VKGMKTTKRKV